MSNSWRNSQSPTQYIEMIQSPNSWGGAIELSVLSHAFKTSIVSIDVATGRVDHYNENYDQRIFLMYSLVTILFI